LRDLVLAKKEVAYSALLEGSVSDLAVFVLVNQPGWGAWRFFPATTDGTKRDTGGGYRCAPSVTSGSSTAAASAILTRSKPSLSTEPASERAICRFLFLAGTLQSGLITVKRVK